MRIKFRLNSEMTEIINCLSQHIAAVFGIGCHFRHDEVRLAECGAFGVDTNENLCNFINIKRMIKFNHTNLTIRNALQFGNGFIHIIRFDALID